MCNEVSLVGVLPQVQGVASVADILAFRARSQGQKEAIVCDDQRITYNTLLGRAKNISYQLKALGITAGDKVGLYLPNSVEFIAAFYGVLGLGCTIVPINPLLKADEISHILSDSESKALIVHETLLSGAETALQRTPHVTGVLLIPSAHNGLLKTPQLPCKAIEVDARKCVESLEWTSITDPDALAALVYTSGTTGKPKGAMLTHHNLLSVFPARLDLFDINETDRCLCMLPLCHIYGVALLVIGVIARAGTLIIMPKFDAAEALKLIEKEEVTILPAVPAMYQFMLAELAKSSYDLSSLRLCFSGAAPLPAEVKAAIESSFRAPAIEGYALTETACVATINPLKGTRKSGSVGPAVPGVQICVFDDNFQQLSIGPEQVGQIAVSGPNIMAGYYKQPEASADVLQNGWFLTGDLGYIDADGYLYIVGRKKELILRGGFNVYPKEVEDTIMKIPGVFEAAVIGVPDEKMGERVKAFVVTGGNPEITEELVKKHCTEHLADYKVPRFVEFIAAIPRNSTGKVLKRLLQ